MPGRIFQLGADGRLTEMSQQEYPSEDKLQELLANYSDLLAGDQIDSEAPRRWLLIARELGIPDAEQAGDRWSVDHLFMDQDGIPTLVEAKRSRNPEIRREVVGQLLEYAANAVTYWPVETIRAQFEATCKDKGNDHVRTLKDFLGPEGEPEAFWRKVKTNLQLGRVRLIFAADEIPPELRRIAEFLNGQMDPAEVLALEIRQFTNERLTTLVPRIMGQTAQAQQRKSPSIAGVPWERKSFLQELQGKRGQEEAAAAEKILNWAQEPMWIDWGRGKKTGSFVPAVQHDGLWYQLFSVTTNGKINIYFYAYQTRPPFKSQEKRLELLSNLNSFLVEKIPADAINRYPTIALGELKDADCLKNFLETYEWFIEQIRGT